MNIYQLISESPWVSFFLGLIILSIIGSLVNLVNRIMRHWNIHKHGYPPPHCDADGDFKKIDEEIKGDIGLE